MRRPPCMSVVLSLNTSLPIRTVCSQWNILMVMPTTTSTPIFGGLKGIAITNRMDMSAIKKRRRELCGVSRPSDAHICYDELAIIFSLTCKGIPATRRNVLIEWMKIVLKEMPESVYKPFWEALMEIYKELK